MALKELSQEEMGHRLRWIRKDLLGMSGEEFGSLLGVTQATISNYEGGARRLYNHLVHIANRSVETPPLQGVDPLDVVNLLLGINDSLTIPARVVHAPQGGPSGTSVCYARVYQYPQPHPQPQAKTGT